MEMYPTIDDEDLTGDAFSAAELNDLVSHILDCCILLEQRVLTHGIHACGGHPRLSDYISGDHE